MSDIGQSGKIAAGSAVPILIVLSGPRRGHTELLTEKSYFISLDAEENVYFNIPDVEPEKDYHAILHRFEDTYEIEVAPDHHIWVSGEQVKESQVLKPGDLLEIGHKGPVIRYRSYSNGLVHKKSLSELVSDCFNGAQVDGVSRFSKTTRFLKNITHDFATQTTLWFRVWVLILITLLVISFIFLVMQNVKLQKRVATEDIRIESIEGVLEKQKSTQLSQQDLQKLKTEVKSIEEVLEEQKSSQISQQDLLQLKTEVETQLSGTFERLEELETGIDKTSKNVALTMPSVVFLLGTFGFVDPETGLLFRYIQSADGLMTRYTFEEEGQPVEISFTGSAFVISDTGLLLTNRHVMEPWKDSSQMDIAQGRELLPTILQLKAYYPELDKPLEVTAVHASDYLDLALLRTAGETNNIKALEFEPRVPEVGDEVLLLGYPTGLRALVARANSKFIEEAEFDNAINYWSVADRLSEAGYIKPLVTRGIIGQITDKFIVYDAETSFGGSGGPVIDQNGKVIAVSAALIPEFGGSNMGLPAQHAQYFLSQSQQWKVIGHSK
jgi:serine protease Do